jgi:hypothetical protein
MTWRARRTSTCGTTTGFLGDYTEMIAASALRSAGAITGAVAAFADAGFDDLILDPTVADISQVDRLADVVF